MTHLHLSRFFACLFCLEHHSCQMKQYCHYTLWPSSRSGCPKSKEILVEVWWVFRFYFWSFWVGLGFFFFCFLLLSNYLWICISLNLLVRCGSAGKKPKSTYSASVFLKLIKLVSLPPSLLLPHFFKLLNCSYLNPHGLPFLPVTFSPSGRSKWAAVWYSVAGWV